MRRTAAVLIACVPLMLVPATAAHAKSSGPSSTPAPAPGPALVSGPCATITLPKPLDSLNIAGKTSAVMKLSVALKSCSSGPQTLRINVTDSAYQNLGGADCSIAPFTLGPVDLRSGDSRTFTFDTPEPPAMICTHTFTETLVASDGTLLGTALQRFNTTSRI